MYYHAWNYAHHDPEDADEVEHLTEPADGAEYEAWPEDVAKRYVASHNPGYEIGYEFLYDDERNKVIITAVTINGQVFEAPE